MENLEARARRIVEVWTKKLPVTPGGYAENVTSGWTEEPVTSRTLAAQARLAYTFCHCRLAQPRLSGVAAEAVDGFMRVFWNPGLRGWIHSVSPQGDPEDTTIDTWDQSFGLLALAWDFRVRGNPGSKEAALKALAGLNEYAAAPAGGYLERREGGKAASYPGSPSARRQDPHMHLFEAFIAWHAADPSGPWLEQARAILRLLREKFRGPKGGPLAAYFDADLNPAPGDAGKIRIPGDHYEWTWLLRQYEKVSGDSSVQKDAESLYGFAQNHGKDSGGFAVYAVDEAGNLLDGARLFWPQLEMLKAHTAIYEWTGGAAVREEAEKTIKIITERYLRGDELFCNRIEANGAPEASPTATRLIYHLFVAACEAGRVLSACCA
ncbi:MAG: AGE family epimerase/isomerase [Spirochaetales bacterium]|jgi:mannose-6-phosphate isomerase|nr:AGE family epimerase/isomerase [Spirochaetales bacterium]